jgi:hypothetical protein
VGTTVTINLDLPFFPGPDFELANMSIKFTDDTGATIYDPDRKVIFLITRFPSSPPYLPTPVTVRRLG